jgi:uncharacterized damage-inducible protein DinB
MTERERFLELWASEATTTLKVMSRIPDGSDYRPDPKSRTAQEIAWQIVNEERMIVEAIERGTVTWEPDPMPATMQEVMKAYEKKSGEVIERWRSLPQERWDGTVDFFGNARPAARMAWSFLFDVVHHRGQISTYLRPMGSTVPQIYGPSADEP